MKFDIDFKTKIVSGEDCVKKENRLAYKRKTRIHRNGKKRREKIGRA